MRKLICRIFGCSWKYLFTLSNSYTDRADVRVCRCCGKVQHYKKIPTLTNGEYVWMNMVEFTKSGAKNYWKI